MPIDDVNYASLRAISFARTICKDITVVHIATDTKRAEKIQEKMHTYAPDLKLVIIESPLRAFMRPLLTYVDFHHRQHPQWICDNCDAGIHYRALVGTIPA